MNMAEMIGNTLEWFLQVWANVCDTFYNLISTEIDLSLVGLGHTSLIVVLLGGGLLVLIVYKIIQWITPIV